MSQGMLQAWRACKSCSPNATSAQAVHRAPQVLYANNGAYNVAGKRVGEHEGVPGRRPATRSPATELCTWTTSRLSAALHPSVSMQGCAAAIDDTWSLAPAAWDAAVWDACSAGCCVALRLHFGMRAYAAACHDARSLASARQACVWDAEPGGLQVTGSTSQHGARRMATSWHATTAHTGAPAPLCAAAEHASI